MWAKWVNQFKIRSFIGMKQFGCLSGGDCPSKNDSSKLLISCEFLSMDHMCRILLKLYFCLKPSIVKLLCLCFWPRFCYLFQSSNLEFTMKKFFFVYLTNFIYTLLSCHISNLPGTCSIKTPKVLPTATYRILQSESPSRSWPVCSRWCTGTGLRCSSWNWKQAHRPQTFSPLRLELNR